VTPTAVITHLASALPAQVVTNADLMREFPDWDMDRMAERTGVVSRHIALTDETAADLGLTAAQRALAGAGLEAAFVAANDPQHGVDAYSSIQPRFARLALAAALADEISLNHDGTAFELRGVRGDLRS
jgi:3-oxoacyl-[acyl-carrier-protein] synthase III